MNSPMPVSMTGIFNSYTSVCPASDQALGGLCFDGRGILLTRLHCRRDGHELNRTFNQ